MAPAAAPLFARGQRASHGVVVARAIQSRSVQANPGFKEGNVAMAATVASPCIAGDTPELNRGPPRRRITASS